MIQKLTSRKFWIMAAAFLASLGTSIGALATQNEIVAGIGIVCTMLSAAIYAASEAAVDCARESSTTTSVTATSNAKETVLALAGKEE